MLLFNYLVSLSKFDEEKVSSWISNSIEEEGFKEGELNYIFCDDDYLLEKNVKFLNHNTLTDIISFDYTIGKLISGDIFISVERVEENAKIFNVSFDDELQRVMIHGILHFCKYKDKTEQEKKTMRAKEDYYLSLREFD